MGQFGSNWHSYHNSRQLHQYVSRLDAVQRNVWVRAKKREDKEKLKKKKDMRR